MSSRLKPVYLATAAANVFSRVRGVAWRLLLLASGCSIGRMKVGSGFRVRCGSAPFGLEVGPGLHAKRWCSFILDGGRLSIGSNLFMNNDCSINCLDSITIGDNCLFGERVAIYDHDHAFGGKLDTREGGFRRSPVVIGRNVWLGSNVVVLRGTTIGDDVVVGANCVVKGTIPSNTVLRASSDAQVLGRQREARAAVTGTIG